MRRFVIIGNKAKASPDFLLVDIPSTSGRLDVLLRCLRAALLISHGLRRDTIVYLVLLGDPAAPATLRVDGAAARYMRPDERSLATVIKKALAVPNVGPTFSAVRPGIAIAHAGLAALSPELDDSALYVLDEGGEDIREQPLPQDAHDDATFVLGDHTGFAAETRRWLEQRAARALHVGPQSLHAEDVIALVHNELDRRARPQAPQLP